MQDNIHNFDISEHLNDTFLIGGYRTKKGQLRWILGKTPSRSTLLYNVRFSPCKQACRDGAISSGELPKYIVLYDFLDTTRSKLRIFDCNSYSILNEKEMCELKYPNPKGSYIVYTLGEEYDSNCIDFEKLDYYARQKYSKLSTNDKKKKFNPYIVKGLDILRANNGELPLQESLNSITMIDLFAGLGGFHHAFDKLGAEMGFEVNCVFASELKSDLRHLYAKNYGVEYDSINPDITLLSSDEKIRELVPPHDVLCGGFPCQPFSKAGKQQGFEDEGGRGVLFNYIADIIRVRRPKYIFLENVSNLEVHDEGKTWEIIQKKLSDKIENGGLNYDIRAKVISPHEYGFPQHRKRIYIVGIDRMVGTLDKFDFPVKPKRATCDISAIMEHVPTEPQPIGERHLQYIKVWQQFLNFCAKNHAVLPQGPIWAMEFGASYSFEGKSPALQSIEELQNVKGKFGTQVIGSCIEECLSCLPNYAQGRPKEGDESFPEWKKKFIRENRKFYEDNKSWIDPWKEQILEWDNSFIKLEWNCENDGIMDMGDKILQFRPSGLRVKRPTYSPALTFTNSQVPIFPGATFKDENGKTLQGRFMTTVEASRIQGMGDLCFEGLTNPRIYSALGNAVDVEIIKMIAKNLIN